MAHDHRTPSPRPLRSAATTDQSSRGMRARKSLQSQWRRPGLTPAYQAIRTSRRTGAVLSPP